MVTPKHLDSFAGVSDLEWSCMGSTLLCACAILIVKHLSTLNSMSHLRSQSPMASNSCCRRLATSDFHTSLYISQWSANSRRRVMLIAYIPTVHWFAMNKYGPKAIFCGTSLTIHLVGDASPAKRLVRSSHKESPLFMTLSGLGNYQFS